MKGDEDQPDPSWQTAKGAGNEGLVTGISRLFERTGRCSLSCEEHFPTPSTEEWVTKAELTSLLCWLHVYWVRELKQFP